MPKEQSVFVVTADQISSRQADDAVPVALSKLANVHDDADVDRAFVRTAGDEIQGLITQPAALVDTLRVLIQLGQWRIGVGVGSVERPVPDDVRAATGPAFFHAREAVNAARSAPQRVKFEASESQHQTCSDLQAATWMLAALWNRRTHAGWDVAERLAGGATTIEVAQQLGVTPSAVSQRAKVALVDEVEAGESLVAALGERALTSSC